MLVGRRRIRADAVGSSWFRRAALAAILWLPVLPAQAQSSDYYEQLYGPIVDVSITDLAQDADAYQDRGVRTHGRLSPSMDVGRRGWVLRDGFANSVSIIPLGDAGPAFESESMHWAGSEVEITGVVRRGTSQTAQFGSTGTSNVVIQFWSFLGPPEKTDVKGEIKAVSISLEHLLGKPGERDGQTVRVVGKFRGRNLYGDLPARSQRVHDDWVIKDDLFAVWVTDRKPKGDGFSLDASLKRDTGKWLEVIGRPETRGGITYLRALRVSLSSPPTPTAQALPPSPPPERPKRPPVVVFAIPLDGDREVPADSRFVVQFSKDIDEDTLPGRVRMSYSGPRRPGDSDFGGLRFSYDRGRRALTVDPGDVLRPGREIDLMLLPGILDIEGLPLESRSGKPLEQAADVLHYQIGF